MPATTAPQPRPLPEGQGHIIRQGGQQRVVVWCAIMSLLFTRRVPPCQPYFRVVDKDWAGDLVTAHAAYPFAPPAPPSPPVAWGEPEAYAKVTSRTQHLESIADADPPGPASCFSGRSSSGASVRPTIRSDNDVPTIWFLHTPAPRPAQRPHGARGADAPRRRRHPNSPRRPRLSARRVPAGHRSQDPQATEHRGDARPRQPGLGLRRRRLGGGARRVDDLVMLLDSVLVARRRVMLEVNASAECLEAVVAVLPSMRQATVAPLYGNGGYAVKAAVPREALPEVIPAVKAAGGTDLVVSTFSQIVP